MIRWNSGRNYTDDDIQRMQKDALRRVQEMKDRSQRTLSQANGEHPSHSGNPPIVPPPPAHSQHNQHNQNSHQDNRHEPLHNHSVPIIVPLDQPHPESSPIEKILQALNLDHERLILLGVLVILINEHADKTIIMAVIYLLFV